MSESNRMTLLENDADNIADLQTRLATVGGLAIRWSRLAAHIADTQATLVGTDEDYKLDDMFRKADEQARRWTAEFGRVNTRFRLATEGFDLSVAMVDGELERIAGK